MMFLLTARLLATLSAMLALSPSSLSQAAVQAPAAGIEQAAEPSTRASYLAQPAGEDQELRAFRLDDPVAAHVSSKRMVRPCVRTGNRMVC